MKILAVLALAVAVQGCDQIRSRMTLSEPEPVARLDPVDIEVVAEVTIAGPRAVVERIIARVVEQEPRVLTLVKKEQID